MKYVHFFSLLIGSGAASILASTSPAQALSWNLNATFTDGGTARGSFDYNVATSAYSNVDVAVSGPAYTYNFTTASIYPGETSSSNLTLCELGASCKPGAVSGYSGPRMVKVGANTSWSNPAASLSSSQYYFGWAGGGASLRSGSVTSVPFEIPGGSTMLTLGSVLALSLMRKARKIVASNTHIVNPASGTIS